MKIKDLFDDIRRELAALREHLYRRASGTTTVLIEVGGGDHMPPSVFAVTWTIDGLEVSIDGKVIDTRRQPHFAVTAARDPLFSRLPRHPDVDEALRRRGGL